MPPRHVGVLDQKYAAFTVQNQTADTECKTA